MNKKTFYITTPIYYPSGDLHIGHLYTTTLARTFANYKELNGYDVKFLTGADEHGQKIESKAKEQNIDPQEYVDNMSSSFENLWKKLEIKYDYFSRTTNQNHKSAVAQIFSTLLSKEIIYKGKYNGLYSVQDEEFFTITQAEKKDDGYYHPVSGHKLETIEEESYFLKISEYQDWLKTYIADNPKFIIPEKIVNELLNNFVDKGLEDLSVSRTSFDWGIKVNEDDKHVIYVWLDALNNYITALGYNSDDTSDFDKYWTNGDEIVHLVGKEITRFHCIYWPIILKALDLRQPTTILSHGWIITPEGKMSKSKGNVINPIELIEEFGVEQVKYFFGSQIKLGKDGIFDKEILKNSINSDLANNFGNLLSRTVAMTLQNFDKPVTLKGSLEKVDKEIFELIETTLKDYKENFDKFDITEAFEVVFSLSRKLNGYIDVTEPWTLKEDKERLEVVLNTLLNGIYTVTTLLSVLIPNKAELARQSLNIDELSLDKILDFKKFDEVIVNKGEVLFERIA